VVREEEEEEDEEDEEDEEEGAGTGVLWAMRRFVLAI
jgi:hypothetical protein